MVSEKNRKKKNLRGYFGKRSCEVLNRILSICRYYINSICVLCKDAFLKFDMKRL